MSQIRKVLPVTSQLIRVTKSIKLPVAIICIMADLLASEGSQKRFSLLLNIIIFRKGLASISWPCSTGKEVS
jgi:hypothetical protein